MLSFILFIPQSGSCAAYLPGQAITLWLLFTNANLRFCLICSWSSWVTAWTRLSSSWWAGRSCLYLRTTGTISSGTCMTLCQDIPPTVWLRLWGMQGWCLSQFSNSYAVSCRSQWNLVHFPPVKFSTIFPMEKELYSMHLVLKLMEKELCSMHLVLKLFVFFGVLRFYKWEYRCRHFTEPVSALSGTA